MKRTILTILLWAALTFATLPPWLLWLDMNAVAVRFVQLRGHWPMCDTALPCLPHRGWYTDDAMDTIAHDPVYLRLDPPIWAVFLVLCSVPAWMALRFAFGKHLPPAARRVFLIAFLLGWACLILDPTGVVAWFRD